MNEQAFTRIARPTGRVLQSLMIVLVAACGAAPDASDAPTDAPGQRIGTYDGRAVVIAYANSDLFEQWIGEITRQHDAAKAAGDEARAAEFEAQAVAQQERFHGQAFDGDSIDDVLEQVAADIPAICRQAGVIRLEAVNVERPAGVATLDVTDQLVELFHPDAKARGWIADIRSKPFPK